MMGLELVNQGKDFEVMRTMYAPDIISVEADGREINGRQPVIRHSEVWQGRNTIHSGQLRGPYFSGPDKFAVHFTIDVTRTDSGVVVRRDLELLPLLAALYRVIPESLWC